MGYLLEAAVVLLFPLLLWRVSRQSALRNGLALGAVLLSSGASIVLGLGLSRLLESALPITWRLVVLACIGLLVFGGCVWATRRRLRADDRALERRLAKRVPLPPWLDRVLVGLGMAASTALLVYGLLALVNAWSVSTDLSERSLFLHLLVVSTEEDEPEDDPDPLQSGVDFLGKRTGVTRMVTYLQALELVSGLPAHKRRWLAAHNAHLRDLLDNPRLLDVFADEELMAKVEEAGQGKVDTLNELLEHPKLIALLEDQAFREAVATVDLVDLAEQARQRERAGFPVALYWHTFAHDRFEDLGPVLQSQERWTLAPFPDYLLQPVADRRHLSALTHYEPPEDVELRLILHARGARPSVWINGRQLPLEFSKDLHLAEFQAPWRKVTRILIVLDYQGVTDRQPALIEVLSKPR